MDRALAIVPDNAETRANRGLWYVCWKADTRPLHQTIDAILAKGTSAIASAADVWFFCALAERDPAAAERALVALGDNPCWTEGPIILSRSFGEGLLARMTKDEARARTAFEVARAQQEKIVFRHHGSLGGEEGACLAATGSWAACSRRIANAELRCLKTAPFLGSASRRSALRKDRRFARPKGTGQVEEE